MKEHVLTEKEAAFVVSKLQSFRQLEAIYQARHAEITSLVQLIAVQNGLEGNWTLDSTGKKLILEPDKRKKE